MLRFARNAAWRLVQVKGNMTMGDRQKLCQTIVLDSSCKPRVFYSRQKTCCDQMQTAKECCI